MIVVMPAGHVNGAGAALGGTSRPLRRKGCRESAPDRIRLPNDFMADLMPLHRERTTAC